MRRTRPPRYELVEAMPYFERAAEHSRPAKS